jgi:hypothetical protein
MAHFAQLDENSVVTQVIVVNNNDCQIDGVETEEIGIVFCKSLFGAETNWKQTSYHGNIRKNYAGIGFSYDAVRDAFIPPKPFASWLLDEGTCLWVSPIPMPSGAGLYSWNESLQEWVTL